jgi:RHS repeat-associated protein
VATTVGGTHTGDLLVAPGLDNTLAVTDESGTTRTLLTDALGSTVGEVDPTGALSAQYAYTPHGQATTTGTPKSPVAYTGRETDPNGLVYLRARYYDPSFGRFISADPIGFGGGDANLYAYAGNAPTILSDPTGLTAGGGGGLGGSIAGRKSGWNFAWGTWTDRLLMVLGGFLLASAFFACPICGYIAAATAVISTARGLYRTLNGDWWGLLDIGGAGGYATARGLRYFGLRWFKEKLEEFPKGIPGTIRNERDNIMRLSDYNRRMRTQTRRTFERYESRFPDNADRINWVYGLITLGIGARDECISGTWPCHA